MLFRMNRDNIYRSISVRYTDDYKIRALMITDGWNGVDYLWWRIVPPPPLYNLQSKESWLHECNYLLPNLKAGCTVIYFRGKLNDIIAFPSSTLCFSSDFYYIFSVQSFCFHLFLLSISIIVKKNCTLTTFIQSRLSGLRRPLNCFMFQYITKNRKRTGILHCSSP